VTTASARILLIEDDPGDLILVRESLAMLPRPIILELCVDGDAACRRLKAAAEDPATRPALVILDLNLPRRDGREVYAAARKEPALARMPILVFTTSKSDHDLIGKGAVLDRYIVKPLRLEGFSELSDAVERSLAAAAIAGA